MFEEWVQPHYVKTVLCVGAEIAGTFEDASGPVLSAPTARLFHRLNISIMSNTKRDKSLSDVNKIIN